jgi:hypothetical protein
MQVKINIYSVFNRPPHLKRDVRDIPDTYEYEVETTAIIDSWSTTYLDRKNMAPHKVLVLQMSNGLFIYCPDTKDLRSKLNIVKP